MRFDDPSKPEPTRGIIVVDACALFVLSAALPDVALTPLARAQKQTVRLAEALFLLAQNGFEVIVPEIVGVECANMLRDGVMLRTYFPQSESKPQTDVLEDIFSRIEIASGSIYVVPPPEDEQSEPAQHVRDLRMACTIGADEEFVRNRIIFLQNREKRDFGEQAAFELIEQLPKTDLPVFFFSTDTEAQEQALQLRPDLSLHELRPTNFFDALGAAGLLKQIGIIDMTNEEFLAVMKDAMKLAMGKRQGTKSYTSKNPDPAFARAVDGIEMPCPRRIAIINGLRRRSTAPAAVPGAVTA